MCFIFLSCRTYCPIHSLFDFTVTLYPFSLELRILQYSTPPIFKWPMRTYPYRVYQSYFDSLPCSCRALRRVGQRVYPTREFKDWPVFPSPTVSLPKANIFHEIILRAIYIPTNSRYICSNTSYISYVYVKKENNILGEIPISLKTSLGNCTLPGCTNQISYYLSKIYILRHNKEIFWSRTFVIQI